MAAKVRSKVTINGELAFPSDFLAAVEFKGRDVTLTISSVSKEPLKMLDGSTKSKLVMRFKETPRKLIANRTNADSIAALHGSKAELWSGKRVTLYPTRCLAFGDMVDCIRVRETVSANGQQSATKPPPPLTLPGVPAEDGDAFEGPDEPGMSEDEKAAIELAEAEAAEKTRKK